MKKKAAEKIDEDWMSTYGDMVRCCCVSSS